MDAERIEDMYEAAVYNGEFLDPVSILRHIHETLAEEQNSVPTPGKSAVNNKNKGA